VATAQLLTPASQGVAATLASVLAEIEVTGFAKAESFGVARRFADPDVESFFVACEFLDRWAVGGLRAIPTLAVILTDRKWAPILAALVECSQCDILFRALSKATGVDGGISVVKPPEYLASQVSLVMCKSPALRSLHLHQLTEDPEAIKHLVSAVVSARNLRQLHLNSTDSASAAHFVEALVGKAPDTLNLHTLSLARCDLCCDEADVVGRLLLKCPELNTLELGGNNFEAEGMRQLATGINRLRRLVTLGVQGNKMHAGGIAALSFSVGELASIRELNLGGNWLGVDGARIFVESMERNSSLGGACPLVRLDLRGNWIQDNGLLAVCSVVERCSSLEYLGLRNNWIGDPGTLRLVQVIDSLNVLRELDLQGNWIKEEGAKAMAHHMRHNRSITSINLSRNWFGEVGVQAFIEVLHLDTPLKDLNLERNDLKPEAIEKIAEKAVGMPARLRL